MSEEKQSPPLGSINNPIFANDFTTFKPENFTVSRISFAPGKEGTPGKEDAFVIALIERDMVPYFDGAGKIGVRSQHTVRTAIEVTETFFSQLVEVARAQKNGRDVLHARLKGEGIQDDEL